MKRRVIDEVDVDVRRLVIFTILASTVNEVEYEGTKDGPHQRFPCLLDEVVRRT